MGARGSIWEQERAKREHKGSIEGAKARKGSQHGSTVAVVYI